MIRTLQTDLKAVKYRHLRNVFWTTVTEYTTDVPPCDVEELYFVREVHCLTLVCGVI